MLQLINKHFESNINNQKRLYLYMYTLDILWLSLVVFLTDEIFISDNMQSESFFIYVTLCMGISTVALKLKNKLSREWNYLILYTFLILISYVLIVFVEIKLEFIDNELNTYLLIPISLILLNVFIDENKYKGIYSNS